MKKVINKTISSLLAVLLIIALPLTAFAQESTAKEETVYAKLRYDGSLNELYVVNSFELDKAGSIVDYGAYSNVRNLTTTDALKTENGILQANAPVGRFYYEGKMDAAQLPWSIQIQYLLDGQEVKADALVGKSGALEIKIEVKKNPNAQNAFFKNYMLQVSLALDLETCSSIQADGATIANAGKNKNITFALLPGNEKNFTIKANVKSFEMGSISFNGISTAMDFELTNRSELTDGFKELTDGVNELNDGAIKLKDGSKDYAAGVKKFAKQTGSLPSASKKIASGLNQTSQGLSSVVKQGNDLKALAQALAQSPDPQVQVLAKGYIAQYEALANLSGGLGQIAAQYDKMDDGIASISSAAKKISSGYGELDDGIVKLADGSAEFKESTSTIDTDINKKIDEMINAFSHKDFVPVSFVSDQNKNVKAVQFVIRTDPIEIPEKEEQAEEDSQPKTFFHRLIALFKPSGE